MSNAMNQPWMYRSVDPYAHPPTFQCPLCAAIVGDIEGHTEYHKARGEEDKGRPAGAQFKQNQLGEWKGGGRK